MPLSASDMQMQHAAPAVPSSVECNASTKTGGGHGGSGGSGCEDAAAGILLRRHAADAP
jgi:hypothetical protein